MEYHAKIVVNCRMDLRCLTLDSDAPIISNYCREKHIERRMLPQYESLPPPFLRIEEPMSQKSIVVANRAPKAIGPYSAATRAGAFIFSSGQLGLIPQSDALAEGGIEGETRQALQNLAAVLEAADSSLERILKTTVYLRDLQDFPRMNAIYAEFFPKDPPARTTIQAAGLPRGAAFEIDCIALAKE
jgi:2-iminobutanoate/2-iminopropanoate deaminase